MTNEFSTLEKALLALASAVFGVAVAVAVQHIKIFNIPKKVILLSLVVQVILSLGVFLGTLLFFKSQLLPLFIPNDEYTAIFCAYVLSVVPQIVITTLLLIYNKQINKWVVDKYGDDALEPPKSFGSLGDYYKDNK